MITRQGAESGGVAQLPDGDVVAIFNEIHGGGHWQARPVDRSDPFLRDWHDTHPNGTACGEESQCEPTPGIPGTDLNGAFLDGSGDGFWRVVANRYNSGGATGAAMLVRTKDFKSFEVMYCLLSTVRPQLFALNCSPSTVRPHLLLLKLFALNCLPST